jgi:hypothetical protein
MIFFHKEVTNYSKGETKLAKFGIYKPMKYLSILFILIFGLSVSGQINFDNVKRIHWTGENGCELHNFSNDEKKGMKVECDKYTRDDRRIRVLKYNDITFYLSITEDGEYIYSNVLVYNGSKERVLIDPSTALLVNWKTNSDDEIPETISPIPPERIAAKIRSRANWANFFTALGGAVAATNKTTNTTTTGNATVYGNNGTSVNGTYTENSTTTTTAPNAQAQSQAIQQNAIRTQNASQLSNQVLGQAMKANTLFENQSTGGTIYFKKMKVVDGFFTLKINDIYLFWRTVKEK